MGEVIYDGGRSVVSLNGNAGQTFSLNVGGGAAGVASYEWSPEDRRVMDLEVRLRVMSAVGSSNATIFRVFYKIEIGAGESSFAEPVQKIFNVNVPVTDHALPARGSMFRVNARRLKLSFRALVVTPPLSGLELAVSVQPCSSSIVPQVPAVTRVPAGVLATSPVSAIPMAANEWRFRQENGQAWAAAANLVRWYTLTGTLFGIFDAALYSDWAPINLDTAFLRSASDTIVQYR
jgi:hypothetical protein